MNSSVASDGWGDTHCMSIMNYLIFHLLNLPPGEEKLLSFKLAYYVTDLFLLSARLYKTQRFWESWVGDLSVSPWVYSQKCVIHVSMADLIVMPAYACICVSRSMCLREPPPLFACLERTSFITIKEPGSSQQAGARRCCQERGNTHAFESLQLPNCFTSGENTQHTHAHTDVSCFLWFPLASLFFALVVFSHHSSCLTQTLYIKPLHFLFLYNKIFVILFTCCVALSGTVHFCHLEGIHWTVLAEGGSWNGTAW